MVQSATERALSAVSEELLHWASRTGDTSGCTAVTAVSLDDSFLAAHIGDSKAILCQQKSQEGTPDISLILLCHKRTLSLSMSQIHTELYAIYSGVTRRYSAFQLSMGMLSAAC